MYFVKQIIDKIEVIFDTLCKKNVFQVSVAEEVMLYNEHLNTTNNCYF